MPADLPTIVDRAQTGMLSPEDIQMLVAAIQTGQVTLVTGQQAVGVGGNANRAIITTGSNNIVLNVTDTAEVLRILQQINPQFVPPQPAPQTVLRQFPETYRFDLSQLIERCLEELYDKRGLVGVVVPCDTDAFLKNFCDRLKFELDRSNTQIRRTLALKPQTTSVSSAVEVIKQYKKLLQISNVICPIRVGIVDPTSSIPKDFWQQLQKEFQETFPYRLIIVMVGPGDCAFPPEAILLQPPQFKRVHAMQWIRDIAQLLNWMQFLDEWVQKMVACCPNDEQQADLLDVGLVYEHLEYTLELLQQEQFPSAEAFLERLS